MENEAKNEGTQEKIGGMTFEQAEEVDMLNSKFFKPKTNIKYELGFGLIEKPDKTKAQYYLYEKMMPDYDDKTKEVKKVSLDIKIVSINGVEVNQVWSVLSPKLRNLFATYCDSPNFLKKFYIYKSTGEGKDKTHALSEGRERV